MRERYASSRLDSIVGIFLVALSCAYFWILPPVKGEDVPEFVEEGRRKGSAPEGEAWLFDGMRSTSTPAILRKVCTKQRAFYD
jgi:hypothetical protein